MLHPLLLRWCLVRHCLPLLLIALGLVGPLAPSLAQVGVPYTYQGPWQSLPTTGAGLIGFGLSSDYTSNLGTSTTGNSAKLDSQGDYIRLGYASAVSVVQFNLKGNPSTGSTIVGTFKVQESVSGSSWTDMLAVVNKSNVDQVYQVYPDPASRYVRFLFSTKTSGNLQFDALSVTNNPVLTLATNDGSLRSPDGFPACVTSTGADISLDFWAAGTGVGASTAYSLQLSDASGSWTSPTVIGTLTGATPGLQTIMGHVPPTVAAGSSYRLRVVGTGPTLTSEATAAQTITLAPATNPVTVAPATAQTIAMGGVGTLMSATTAASSTIDWYYGTSIGGPFGTGVYSGSDYQPAAADFGNVPGTYYVVAVATSDCGNVVGQSAPITVQVVSPAAQIVLKQGTTTLAPNDAWDFGNRAWGDTTSVVFTVTNPGSAALTLTLPLTTGSPEFVIPAQPASSVPAGGSVRFRVRFVPAGLNTRTATITIQSNAGINSSYPLNLTGTGLPSNRSGLLAGSITYASNILYASYQGSTITSSSNTLSVPIFAVTVKDGALNTNSADADNLPTILDRLTFSSVQNIQFIRAAALFNGNSLVSNTPVINTAAGTITFSNLYAGASNPALLTANDPAGSFTLTLRVTFSSAVTDNQQVRVSVAAANAGALTSNSSTFGAFTTLVSSTTSDRNRMEVVATQLRFNPAPPSSSVTNVGLLVGVEAIDGFQNRDLDATPTVTLTRAAGTGAYSSALGLTRTLAGGYLLWTDVKYNTPETASLTTANLSSLTNATPAVTTFTAFNGLVWDGGAGTTNWDDALNWSGDAVPTAADDVRLDNSVVQGSFSVTMTGAGHAVRTLAVGYLGNPNAITLTIAGGSPSADNLVVGGGTSGRELSLNDGALLVNNATVSGAGNRAIEFGAGGSWQMLGTATYRHNQATGDFPARADGTLSTSFAQTSTFEVRQSGTWAAPAQGLRIIKEYGNLLLNFGDVTPRYLSAALTPADTLLVLGSLRLTNNSRVVQSAAGQLRTEVYGDVVLDANTAFAVSDAVSHGGRLVVLGNITTDATASIAAASASGAGGLVQLGGNLAGRWLGTSNDTLLLTGPGTALLAAEATSGMRYLRLDKVVKLMNDLGGTQTRTVEVTSNGVLDFNQRYIGGNGPFILKAGGTLRITDPSGLSATVGDLTGVLRTTSGARTFSQSATYWYAGTTPQVTGSALTSGGAPRTLIIDNPTTVTLSNSTSISGGGVLDIRQGTFQETSTAAVSGSGVLRMSGGTYAIVKENANDASPILLPQLDTELSGVSQLTGGTIALLGPGVKQQVLRGSRSYVGLTFGSAGTKRVSSAINGTAHQITGTVTIADAALVDFEDQTIAGPGNLTMTGGRLRSIATGTFPGLTGAYSLTGGTIEYANPRTLTAQTVRGNDASYTRTYFNIDVTGFGVSTSTGDFAIGAGGTFTVREAAAFEIASTRRITGAGAFVLERGSTFRYGHPDGITLSQPIGNIQVTGGRTFPANANYGFVGTANQVTGDGLPATVGVLYMLKSAEAAQVQLSQPLTVSSALILTRGRLVLGAHDLTIGPLGAISGGSTNCYLVTEDDPAAGGSLRATVPAGGLDVVFPIGTSASYTPATLRLSAASQPDVFGMRVFTGVLRQGTSGGAVADHVVNRTWLVEEATPGGSSATLQLQWNAAEELGLFNRANCRIGHFDSSLGIFDRGPMGPASGSNPYTLARGGITSFSPFAVGDDDSVLPVELARFDAQPAGAAVALTWLTASETNSAYFEVQRSATGTADFRPLGRVPAAGQSLTAREYAFRDERPLPGVSYYRLRQVDLDGTEHFGPVRVVRHTGVPASGASVEAWPVPVQAELTLRLTTPAAGTATVRLFDLQGRVVWRQALELGAAQPGTVTLDTRSLSAGTYVAELLTPTGEVSRTRVLKQ